MKNSFENFTNNGVLNVVNNICVKENKVTKKRDGKTKVRRKKFAFQIKSFLKKFFWNVIKFIGYTIAIILAYQILSLFISPEQLPFFIAAVGFVIKYIKK